MILACLGAMDRLGKFYVFGQGSEIMIKSWIIIKRGRRFMERIHLRSHMLWDHEPLELIHSRLRAGGMGRGGGRDQRLVTRLRPPRASAFAQKLRRDKSACAQKLRRDKSAFAQKLRRDKSASARLRRDKSAFAQKLRRDKSASARLRRDKSAWQASSPTINWRFMGRGSKGPLGEGGGNGCGCGVWGGRVRKRRQLS